MKSKHRTSDFNFWPSIADMILAVFMTFLILWFVEKFLFLSDLALTKQGIAQLEDKFSQCKFDVAQAQSEVTQVTLEAEKAKFEATEKTSVSTMALVRCEGEKDRCLTSLRECHQEQDTSSKQLGKCENQLKICQAEFQCDKPPIITLDEASGYNFETGSANLSEEFKAQLQNKIQVIKSELLRYKANVIEIIGHTDGQIAGGQGNLDRELEDVAAGTRSIDTLRYGSNADLGLIRALAVALFLEQELKSQTELVNVKFRVYSAAQLILPTGELALNTSRTANEQRRRIELRFTRLER